MAQGTEQALRIGSRPASSSLVMQSAARLDFNTPLPPSLLNIEAKTRSNLFPWRGQFSPQLVEALLQAYAVPGSMVLDPFMGSGTVLVEAARLRLPVNGCEVNPAAYLLARVYGLCELPLKHRLDLLAKVERMLARVRPSAFELPLFCTAASTGIQPSDFLHWVRSSQDPCVSMLLQALTVLLDGGAHDDSACARHWAAIREVVTGLPETETAVNATINDARQLLLPGNSVDFVLSSPPYINVFNYHHNLRSGVESLGWKPLVVARSEIGANRKFRQNRFLTVVQYCVDMALALMELRRVCKGSARILLVLGKESNVHKTPFYNGQILESLAVNLLGFRLRLKQERVFLNRFGQSIYEDLLHFSPGPLSSPISNHSLIEHARSFGKNELLEARERTPNGRKRFLEDAIARAEGVEPSPILQAAAASGEPE